MTFKQRLTAFVLLAAAVSALACSASAAEGVLLGDSDQDGAVTILDATAIQRNLAALPVRSFSEAAADVDGSGQIEITDATYIQRWLAGIETPYPINEQLAEPTEPAEEPPSQWPTDSEGWGHEIFRP